MIPKKVKGVWKIGNKKISGYELYNVFGLSPEFIAKFGKVRPAQFTTEHVNAYLEAKKNKTGAFRDKVILSAQEVFSKFSKEN